MANQRRNAGRTFVRGAKRKTTWIGPADQGSVSVGNGLKVLVSSFDAFAVGLPEPTIVRTRGVVGVRPTLFTTDQDIAGAIGMAVVTDRAFTAGASSIPGPWTDSGWDGWLVWRSFSYHLDFSDETGKVATDWSFEVDSKGMRKMTGDETFVVMVESQVGVFGVFDGTRHLFMLS